MDIFTTLYKYECKKIWDRKLVKISFLLCLALTVFMCISPIFGIYRIDGEVIGSAYNESLKDQTYARELNGRKIDQQLLEEMVEAYRKVFEEMVEPYQSITTDAEKNNSDTAVYQINTGKHYTATHAYQKYARPYSEIYGFVTQNTDLYIDDIFNGWEPSEEDLYRQRQAVLERDWEKAGLSESEINFWRERESRVEKPVVFQENYAYSRMLINFQTIAVFVIVSISVSLSGVFPEEHSRRTDQLVLSSPNGKEKLYRAKIAAGITYAVGIVIVFVTVMWVLMFILYGGQGFNAPLQLIYAFNSDSITIGQAILIEYGIILITAVIISIIVMFLSELLRSNMAAMSISAGILIATMMVSIPQYYRLVVQIWDWQPWRFVAPWNIFGNFTLPFFGTHLTPWQAVPMIYILVSLLVVWAGKSVYNRYQVSGR